MKTARLHVDKQLSIDSEIILEKEAYKYIVRVLRRGEGDQLDLFNGDGFNYHSILGISESSIATATIQSRTLNATESPLNINLVQSLAKGTKLDLIIQKATELGVTQITPVTSERSILQIDKNRLERKLSHWRGVAVSAATQCQRSVVPIVEPPVLLNDWLENRIENQIQNNAEPASCFLLHPSANKTLKEINLPSTYCSVLVGPEGGFTEDEVNYAEAHGATSFQCGPRVLRTETAGFTAIAVLQSLYGDF